MKWTASSRGSDDRDPPRRKRQEGTAPSPPEVGVIRSEALWTNDRNEIVLIDREGAGITTAEDRCQGPSRGDNLVTLVSTVRWKGSDRFWWPAWQRTWDN